MERTNDNGIELKEEKKKKGVNKRIKHLHTGKMTHDKWSKK